MLWDHGASHLQPCGEAPPSCELSARTTNGRSKPPKGALGNQDLSFSGQEGTLGLPQSHAQVG